MMSRLFCVLAGGLAVLASGAASARAEASWSIDADEGSCLVTYVGDPSVKGVAPIHAFRWEPNTQLVWMVMADAAEGTEQGGPLELKVTTALGPSFGGDAEHFVVSEEAIQGYALATRDRKDVATLISGDITFSYQGLEGRPVTFTMPAAQQLPRIRQCMTQARLQAQAMAEAGQRPTRAAREAAPQQETGPQLIGTGTGVFINNQGMLLTNAHVIEGCRAVGNPTLGGGKLLAVDEASDLALLQFENAPKGFVSLRSSALRLGEGVTAAGYPLRSVLNNGLNITTGNVSALSGIGGDRRYVQITAPVQPGNSGGPLLDSSGRLVGIVSGKLSDRAVDEGTHAQNINYAVAPFIVHAFLQEHGVKFSEARDSRETLESLAGKARLHTVALDCVG